MKSSLKLLLILSTLISCSFVSAESHQIRVELTTNQCVYIEGDKECTYGANPIEDFIFKLIKNTNGKYTAYRELSTYVGSDQFKVAFTIVKDHQNSEELQVTVNLITITSAGEKNSAVNRVLVSELSELESLSFDGVPIERYVQHYLTVTGHSITFY